MKKRFFRPLMAMSALAAVAASCGLQSAGPVPEDIVGDQAGELQSKISELLEQAGTDTTKAEFAQITSTFLAKPGDNTATVQVQIVSPKDKDKMEQFDWTDMKDRRNHYERFDLAVSTFLDSDAVDTYEGYKEMLFTYADASKSLNSLRALCKEALEASGYKDKGYVDNFTLSADRAFISVKNKEGGFSKTYDISADGAHIVKPD